MYYIITSFNFPSYLQNNRSYTCCAHSRYILKFSSISSTLFYFQKINLCVSTYHLSNYFNFHTQILMFFFSESAFLFKSYNLWNHIKIKYYMFCFSCSTATHSTWLVGRIRAYISQLVCQLRTYYCKIIFHKMNFSIFSWYKILF